MHTLGTVLLALTLLVSTVGSFYAAKFIQVRNSYVSKVVASREKFKKAEDDLRDRELQLNRLEAEFQRLQEPWGPAWSWKTDVTSPAEGKLTVEFPADQAPVEKTWIYGFEVKADGTSMYRGDFQVVSSREGRALLQPNWRLRPNETNDWASGQWRWRKIVPAGHLSRMTSLVGEIAVAEELLSSRRQNLSQQDALIAEAKSQLEMRVSELVGGPGLLSDKALPLEFREGLLPALVEEEEERNAALLAIDGLRRKVKAARERLNSLIDENRQIVNSMPQPAKVVSQNKR